MFWLNDSHSLRFYWLVQLPCHEIKGLIAWMVFRSLRTYYTLFLRKTVVIAIRKWMLEVNQACKCFVSLHKTPFLDPCYSVGDYKWLLRIHHCASSWIVSSHLLGRGDTVARVVFGLFFAVSFFSDRTLLELIHFAWSASLQRFGSQVAKYSIETGR